MLIFLWQLFFFFCDDNCQYMQAWCIHISSLGGCLGHSPGRGTWGTPVNSPPALHHQSVMEMPGSRQRNEVLLNAFPFPLVGKWPSLESFPFPYHSGIPWTVQEGESPLSTSGHFLSQGNGQTQRALAFHATQKLPTWQRKKKGLTLTPTRARKNLATLLWSNLYWSSI